MNKSYIVAIVKENNLFYAYTVPVVDGVNIKHELDGIKGLQWAEIYYTKKKAAAIAEMWNQYYKKHDRYLFAKPLF